MPHYLALSLLQPFYAFRFPSLLRCRRHAVNPPAPPRMPSPKKVPKKPKKKQAPPLESSSASQEPSQVWPPKTPSYLGPPTPSTATSAYQDSPDLFAEDFINPVVSKYSEHIPTPGGSAEHRPSVVTLVEPRIQVMSAAEEDENSDDPAMQQSGQDLSIMERELSEQEVAQEEQM